MDLDQTSILNGRLTQLESLAAAAKVDTLWAIGASVAVFALCFFSTVSPITWGLAGATIILAMVVWLVCQQISRRPPPITRVKSWEKLVASLVGINGLTWGLLGAYSVSQTSIIFALAVVAISAVG